VILFNGGKFAEAKTQFEAATKADPNHALAQYQLGMTSLNLGQIQDAVNALEAYLKVDPNGPKAAEVKASLPALQGMLKKVGFRPRPLSPIGCPRSAPAWRRRPGTAGRDPSSIRLVAVSKTFPTEAVREAYAAGQREFGENRVQEGLQKIGETTDLTIRWHLLGHLQTNKARKAGPAFAMVQSVDSVELIQKLDAPPPNPDGRRSC
jgi:tetratricopeptide (TPR) repeat protein